MPDAIILDIILPDTDGFKLLEEIQSDQATKNIPVLMVSVVEDKILSRYASEYANVKFLCKCDVSFEKVVTEMQALIVAKAAGS